MVSKTLLVLLAVFLFGAFTVRAQDEDVDVADAVLEDMVDEEIVPLESEGVAMDEDVIEVDDTAQLGLSKSPDAECTVFFPDFSTHFPAGSTVTVIVGFKNAGTSTFRINDIEASFRHPGDFSYSVWNFTQQYIDTTVESGDSATIFYQFTPPETTDPRDFGFVVNVNYFDGENAQFQESVVNTTIQVIESQEETDYYMMAFKAIVAAAALYYSFVQITSVLGYKPAAVISKSVVVERGTTPKRSQATNDPAIINNEWLSDMRLPASAKSKKVSSPREKQQN